MQYAQNTDVPVERSRSEMEGTIVRYGATGFFSGWQGMQAMVGFQMRNRQLKFILPLPDKTSAEFTRAMRKVNATKTKEFELSPEESRKRWEQACRQRWRALNLVIKAKLEAVESGISEFDSEFLANIVQPDGSTIGERILPQINKVLAGGKMLPLLPGGVDAGETRATSEE